MTDLVTQLATVARCYAEHRRLSIARVSALVFGNGGKLPAIVDGGADMTTRSWEKAMSWFSDNWPSDARWPSEVARPVSAEVCHDTS